MFAPAHHFNLLYVACRKPQASVTPPSTPTPCQATLLRVLRHICIYTKFFYLFFMRQKMITLCPTTFEVAKKMPNFSSWVRLKLMEIHFDNNPNLPTIGAPMSVDCANCDKHGNHFCQPLGMFVRGEFS